jgi:hypothetical protein
MYSNLSDKCFVNDFALFYFWKKICKGWNDHQLLHIIHLFCWRKTQTYIMNYHAFLIRQYIPNIITQNWNIAFILRGVCFRLQRPKSDILNITHFLHIKYYPLLPRIVINYISLVNVNDISFSQSHSSRSPSFDLIILLILCNFPMIL